MSSNLLPFSDTAHLVPWIETEVDNVDLFVSDDESKARINMPYGLKPGMTPDEADRCMQAAGFQAMYDANNGATIYYHGGMIVEGAETQSSLKTQFFGEREIGHIFSKPNDFLKNHIAIGRDFWQTFC